MGLLRSFLRFMVVECPVIPLLIIAPFTIVSDALAYTAIRLSYRSIKRLDNRERHSRKVRDIQKQIREWIEAGRQGKLCTARPSYKNISMMQEFTYKQRMHQVEQKEDCCRIKKVKITVWSFLWK